MYQELINEMMKLSKQYFDEPEIQKLYNQKIKFNFKINDLKPKVNAHVKPIFSENHLVGHDIEIYIGLVDALREYAEQCCKDSNLFHGVGKNNDEKQLKIVSFLLHMWLHFIMFHEWGHAICGHAKYRQSKSEKQDELWLEEAEDDLLCENLNLAKAMELEADSKAAPFLFSPFSMIWENYSKDLYDEINNDYVWTDFIYSILLLFEFFEKRRKGLSDTHPSPMIRIYTCLMFIAGELNDKPHIRANLPTLNLQDFLGNQNPIYQYLSQKMIIFFIEYKKISPEQLIKQLEFASNFCGQVGKIVENAGLSKFRLTKTEF